MFCYRIVNTFPIQDPLESFPEEKTSRCPVSLLLDREPLFTVGMLCQSKLILWRMMYLGITWSIMIFQMGCHVYQEHIIILYHSSLSSEPSLSQSSFISNSSGCLRCFERFYLNNAIKIFLRIVDNGWSSIPSEKGSMEHIQLDENETWTVYIRFLDLAFLLQWVEEVEIWKATGANVTYCLSLLSIWYLILVLCLCWGQARKR